MRMLSIREARAQLTCITKILETAGEVVLTRRGKQVARILPIERPPAPPSHAALRRCGAPLTVASETYVRQDRDER